MRKDNNKTMKSPKTKGEQVYFGQRDPHLDEFVAQIKDIPLLTPKQEVLLGGKVQAGLAASHRLGEELSEDIARDMELVGQGAEAKEQFIEANYFLVISIAYDYYNGHPKGEQYGLMNLIQEGIPGLIRAVEKFDPERGFKFSTYATNWIRQSIQRALVHRGDIIKLTTIIEPQVRKLKRLEKDGLSDEAIKIELQVTDAELQKIRSAAQVNDRMLSLDEPINPSESQFQTRGDFVADARAEEAIAELLEGTDEQRNAALAEAEERIREKLQERLRPKNVELLMKVVSDDYLNDTESRQYQRVKKLLQHPVIQAEMKEFLTVAEDPEDWRVRAECLSEPELFIDKRVITKDDKKTITQICGGCAVRAECRQFFVSEKPGLGRWVGGITRESLLRSRRKKTGTI